RRSNSGTGMREFTPSPRAAEWNWNLAPRLRRFIHAQNELERLATGATIRFRLGLTAQHGEHVTIVAQMTEPIDVRRVRVRRVDELVVVVVDREQPMLDPVHGRAPDLDRAVLPEHGDGTLEVARIREHVDFDDAERAGAEFDDTDAGVVGLDAARLRGRFGRHALHRTDEPLQ